MKKLNDLVKNNDIDKINNSLYKDYKEALNDPDFNLLVSKLNVSENILMKYTSSLKDSTIEFSKCLKCKSLSTCQNKVKGYCYMPFVNDDGSIIFNYQMCKLLKNDINKNKYKNNISLFLVPDYVADAKMSNIYKDDKNRFGAIKWLTTFYKDYQKDKNIKGLYLHGNFGCGKTYLIAALFNELATINIKSTIIFWPEYLRDLKSSFNTDYKEKYEAVKNTPILLIDDIGAENITTWGRDEIFCPLIQYRMEQKLPTFFTSNLNINELEIHFSITKDSTDIVKSKRIISRILQLTDQIEMISENLRK